METHNFHLVNQPFLWPFSIDDRTRIYIDHDVMHGATFPVYDFQKFLTHPFAEARRGGGVVT